MTAYTFIVRGMNCASCGLLLDQALESLPGVTASRTSVRTGQTVVTTDGSVDADTLTAAIIDEGFRARLQQSA